MSYKGRHRAPNKHKKIVQVIIATLILATLFSMQPAAQGHNSDLATIEVVEPIKFADRISSFIPPPPPIEPVPGVIEIELEPIGCPNEGFNGVEPHVAEAGYHLSALFGVSVSSIGGVAGRPNNPSSDHPHGLALDFPVDTHTGNALAEYAVNNADALGITYVLWQVADHYDHVHISFSAHPGTGVSC